MKYGSKPDVLLIDTFRMVILFPAELYLIRGLGGMHLESKTKFVKV